MADREVIVEKPGTGSGLGVIAGIVGLILLVILAYIAFQYFGTPQQTLDTNVNVPTPNVNIEESTPTAPSSPTTPTTPTNPTTPTTP